MEEKKHQMNMGTDPINSLLFKLGIPIMLGMLSTALNSIGDAYFIGGLGTSQLSAILVCAPIGQAVVALGLLFGNGAGAYIPRLLGSKDMEKANKVVSTALFGSLLLGLIAAILIFLNLESILKMLGGTDNNMNFALEYARAYVPSLLLNIFIVTMNSINSSEGHVKLVLFVNSLATILNLILNPIFIYTFNLGVVGAAYGTIMAQGVAVVVLLLNIVFKKSVFNYKLSNFSFDKEIVSPIIKIGFSTLAFQFLTSFSIALVNMQAKEYGDSAVAGIGAVTRVISLGSMMVFGFIKGFQTVAGYNYGAKKYSRLQESIKTSITWSSVFCVIFGLIMIVFSTKIISLFGSGNNEMLQIGKNALRANGLSFMFFGFYTVYSSLLLATGKVKEGFLLGICRQGICFIPIILTIPSIFGLNGIIYAQPIADAISAIITVFIAIKIGKELATLKLQINTVNDGNL